MVDSNKALATPSFAGLFILIAPFMRWEFTSVDENRRSHKLAPSKWWLLYRLRTDRAEFLGCTLTCTVAPFDVAPLVGNLPPAPGYAGMVFPEI